MTFDIEVDCPTKFHPHVANLRKQLPDILRIMKLDTCPKIIFQKRYNAFGTFVLSKGPPHILINIDEITRYSTEKPLTSYNKRKFSDLRYWNPNLYTFVMAHELGHYKQYVDGKLGFNGFDYIWKNKIVCFYVRDNYYRIPAEIDANSWASYVTKELHREKYLYK